MFSNFYVLLHTLFILIIKISFLLIISFASIASSSLLSIKSNNNNNNNNNHVEIPLIKSQTQTTRKIMDSSNLKVEYCENCDVYLGGLFPIHAPKYLRRQTITIKPNSIPNYDDTSLNIQNPHSSTITIPISKTEFTNLDDYFLNDMSCGEIKKERGIQRLEAMLFAIDLINNSTSLLPNIKLGARIFDTCDRDTIALEKCINFVSDYFILNDENIVNDFTCIPSNSKLTSYEKKYQSHMIPLKNKDAIHKRKVIGVIGAASSSVSIQVANLLRLFKVPQISYASTSPELSNKERFPFFSRVLPSDTLQAEAMANLVHHLDWNYIATLNEEGNLGGIDSFITNAKARKICISGSYTLSQTASEDDVRGILTEMYKQKNSRGVVVFLQDHNIRKLLRIVNNLNMTGHFIWIASDSWGTKKESINTNDLAAESAITFSPKTYEIKDFTEYFKKLNPKNNKRNPWFSEYWEEQFNCTMDPTVINFNHRGYNRRVCTGDEFLNITQDGFIHFVIDSVFTMAHALHNLIETHCAFLTKKELIECQHKLVFNGPELVKAIRDVNFTSITGRRVEFIKDKENSGDGLAPFEVFQYQQYEPGKFGYRKITEWEKNKPFKLNHSKLKWNQEANVSPRSVCKEECGSGEIKQGDDCCWVCVKCEENEYVAANRKKCIKCPNGYGPNSNKTMCQKLTIEYMVFNSPFTILPIIFSTLGIVITIYTIFVFIRFNETPIIKASGRELCYVLLAGILCCYLVTFPLVTKPTIVSCFLLRFGFSLSLTVCLSALFTKTNRLSRIFNNSVKQVRQASYVSPKSQLVICFSIVSIQLAGIIIWVLISPPGTSYDYDDPKRVILQCKTHNTHLAISFMYNIFLVILCTIYAVKTRKIPENFNEARFIGFTMYSICIIWIAFIPIFFGTTAAAGTSRSPKNNYKIQQTTMAMCLSLSATVILFCIFMPKLRVVLLKPNKNVRTKSSNLVKSVYKTHQQKQMKDSTVLNSNQANFEKSLTVATGVSSAPSSPGTLANKKPQYLNTFKLTSTNQSDRLSAASIKTKEPSSLIESDFGDENNNSINKLTKTESNQIIFKAGCDLESLDKKKKDLNNNNLITKMINDKNVQDLSSIKTGENKLLIDTKLESNKNDYENLVENEEKNNDKKIDIKLFNNEENKGLKLETDEYEYYIRTRSPNSRYKKSISEKETKDYEQLINEEKEIKNKLDNYAKDNDNDENLLSDEKKLDSNNAQSNEELFNEKTIKTVVEKCFDKISKNKKLPSPYIYIKNKSNTNNTSEKSNLNSVEMKCSNTNKQIVGDEKKDENGICLSSLTVSSCSSVDDIKHTVVEKSCDNSNTPTNTILLSNSNDINELYSLKITFV